MAAQFGAGLDHSGRLAAARIIRHIAVVGIAGIGTGLLVAGGGGRLVMRIAALTAPDRAIGRLTEAGFRVGDITLAGTFGFIFFIGLFVGGIGAVLFLISEPWLARAGRFRGPVFGLFLLLVGSSSSDALDPDNFDFELVGNQQFVVGMFVALFIAYGTLMAPLVTFLERRLPEVSPDRWLRTAGPYLALTLPGLMFPLLLMLFYTSEEACGCGPQYALGGLLVAMAAAMLLVWLAPFYNGGTPWRGTAAFGNLAIGAAAAVGGYHALRDIAEII